MATQSDAVPMIQAAYAAMERELEHLRTVRRREVATMDVTAKVRLTRTEEEYLAIRGQRRELPYEAVLGSDRPHWTAGERVDSRTLGHR